MGLFVSCFVFLTFVLGTLINQPDIPLSINGILTKLSGESAFVLMSLLGATLVPHNFYLHSSIVQVLFPVISNFSSINIHSMLPSLYLSLCSSEFVYIVWFACS